MPRKPERTSFLLGELRTEAKRCAKALGISLGEFLRRAVAKEVAEARKRRRDPLFEEVGPFPEDRVPPRDLARNLNRYLYGEGSGSS